MHPYRVVGDNIYREIDGVWRDVPTPKAGTIRPKNALQKLAWLMCDDPQYTVVAVKGAVGTGKTMVAVLSGLTKLQQGVYQRLIYTRPPVPKQFNLGFLPGTEEEKFDPWIQAFYDQANLVMGQAEIERLIRCEQIEFVCIDKIKGRTFRDTVLIADEAQDTREDTMELLIGRMGENSKIIAVGDPFQIDTQGLTADRNGLVHIENIEDQPDVAVVNLVAPVRSRAAELSMLLQKRRRSRETGAQLGVKASVKAAN